MTSVSWSVPVLICTLASVLLCMNAQHIGQKLNLLDHPDIRKQHRLPTPLMGGITILLVFVPVSAVCILMSVSDRWLSTLLIWVFSIFVMALVGIADDRHSLSPKTRLLISFGLFCAAAALDPSFNVRVLDFNFPKFSMGLGTWWIAIVFTTTCCVGLINAVNMADGKNGLVLGLSIGWLFILATRAPNTLLPYIFLFGAVLAVLFVFNMYGRLFLGDGGAYAIATAIGLLSIMIYNTPGVESLRAVSAEEIMLLFLVPVFDSFRLTYTRLRQGRSPMSADRNHLHHHIQSIFGWPFGLVLYWIVALVPAALLFFADNTKF